MSEVTPEKHLQLADDLAHSLTHVSHLRDMTMAMLDTLTESLSHTTHLIDTLTPMEAEQRELAGVEPDPDPDPDPPTEVLDLSAFTLSSYGGSAQDVNGTATVEDEGATLRFKGNTWKAIPFPYTVTADTVLEFDFSSSMQGEVHAIGFGEDLEISDAHGFQLYGTQKWGVQDFANYTSVDGVKHYLIPAGQFYTGSFKHLFFGNDHDIPNPTAESVFSNIKIYEKVTDPDVDPDDDDEHDHDDDPDPDPEPDPDLDPITPTGGLWSDPANWPDGVLPDPGTNVVLSQDMIIDKVATCRRLTVEAGATVTLAGEIFAHDSLVNYGTVQGTKFQLHFMVEDDRLFQGAHDVTPDPDTSGVGLWNMGGGKYNFQGTPKTHAAKMPFRGDTPTMRDVIDCPVLGQFRQAVAINPQLAGVFDSNLEVPPGEDIVGWNGGDHLLFINEKGQHAIGRPTSSPMDHGKPNNRHIRWNFVSGNGGQSANLIYRNGEVIFQPRTLNLRRSILIDAPLCKPGDTNHRAHTISLHGSETVFKNVEFRNLGPRGKLGLYPIHIHHGMEETSVHIEGCTIWQDCGEPGNRWITLHHTNGAIVRNNIGFMSRGSGFFMEDGSEQNNVIEGNYWLDATGEEELPVVGHPTPRMDNSHCMWVWDGNTIRNNFTANYSEWRKHVTGDHVAGSGVGLVIKNKKGMTDVVENHTHVGGSVGAWAEGDCTFKNLFVYHTSIAVFPSGTNTHMKTVDSNLLNCTGGLGGYAYAGHMTDNTLIICTRPVALQGITMDVVKNSTLIGDVLIRAESYGRVAVGFENCSIDVKSILTFPSHNKTRYNLYSLIVMKGCTGKVGMRDLNHEDHYFTRNDLALPYSFAEGSMEDDVIWRLAKAPEPAGMTWVAGAYNYSVQPVGFPESYKSRSLDATSTPERFRPPQEIFLGYPGYPPGEYVVRGYNQDNTELIGEKTVTVVSGETVVVDFR